MSKRKFIQPVEFIQDNGILIQYQIEEADWIWHPDFSSIQKTFLHFSNEFELKKEISTTIHVSGDERYELYLDGELISRGPDRCGKEHWSFASYELTLPAGKHVFTAELFWLGDQAPAAQVSSFPGFILAAEKLENLLNTGTGNWRVAEKKGISFGPILENIYHAIGPAFIIDGKEYFAEPEFKKAVIVRKQMGNPSGAFFNERNLFPTSIPEQKTAQFTDGTLRAANNKIVYPLPFAAEDESMDPAFNFLDKIVEISANTNINFLWDLENYYCAYSEIEVCGGKGAEIKMEWAESLYLPEKDSGLLEYKGNRDEVAGKLFLGFGETFLPSGGNEKFKSLWWRSGRYILISIATADNPMSIRSVSLETTRYPLENRAEFRCSDKEIEEIIPIGVRAMQMCSHETLMDCPYYEQMMYVGDSRLELMTWYTISDDIRFPERCIELFDWSRWKTGFIAERYPSTPYQLSLTFSMIWICMLHDFMMWRNDVDWLKKRVPGMRCLLENFRALLQEDGLLHGLPGWSFIDWVDEWKGGVPPTDDTGILPIINLQFVYALQKAADIEYALGDNLMAERNEKLANDIKTKIMDTFWSHDKSLLADNVTRKNFSEHSQCLGILTGTVPQEKISDCLHAMLNHQPIAKTTIYYSFYLLETFQLLDRGDLILDKMTLWKTLLKNGFKTTVEQPEPSRSDCHAWGAHPIFHFHASLAGIRPIEPGFKKLVIKPSPGDLEFLNSIIPHPNGSVSVSLDFRNDRCHGLVELPLDTTGVFEYKNQVVQLKSGENSIVDCPPST